MLCPPTLHYNEFTLGPMAQATLAYKANPRMKLVALCEEVEISLCETKNNVMCMRCKKFTNKMCFPSRRNLDATLTCDKMCHSISTLISHLPTLLATKSKGCLQYQYRMGEANVGLKPCQLFSDSQYLLHHASFEILSIELKQEREREHPKTQMPN